MNASFFAIKAYNKLQNKRFFQRTFPYLPFSCTNVEGGGGGKLKQLQKLLRGLNLRWGGQNLAIWVILESRKCVTICSFQFLAYKRGGGCGGGTK